MKLPESFLRFLSYFFVIHQRKVQSSVSGTIEINFANGRKVLDSENTNYSYGALQQVLRYGLTKLNLQRVSSILLLGVGGGSVIKTLQNEFRYKGKITGVELDPILLEMARVEFGVEASDSVNLIAGDANDFLSTSLEKFDLIIIDLFVDTDIPAFVFEVPFWNLIIANLSPEGRFLFNGGFDRQLMQRQQLLEALKGKLNTTLYSGIGGVNALVIGHHTEVAS